MLDSDNALKSLCNSKSVLLDCSEPLLIPVCKHAKTAGRNATGYGCYVLKIHCHKTGRKLIAQFYSSPF